MSPQSSADLLTLARFVLAPVLAVVVGAAGLEVAVAILIAAWITDLLDGRLARVHPGTSRLGAWDPLADAAIAAGLLAGLADQGTITVPFAVILIVVLGGGLVLLRNLALGMLLQAAAYGFFFAALWTDARPWFWVLALAVVPIAAIDGSRFVRVILPDFFGSLRTLGGRRARPLDEEA